MNASQPPPPKRAKTRDGEVGEEDEDGISWSDAEAWLADLGLFAAATATAVARAAGVRPAHVLELAEYFAARRDRWDGDLAVLHQRVRAARVGLAVAAGWKPPCERWRSAQAAARAEYFAAGRARGVPDPVIEDLWRRRCADAVATP